MTVKFHINKGGHVYRIKARANPGPNGPLWGVLGLQDNAALDAPIDFGLGMRTAMVEAGWNSYQPTNGTSQSSTYVSQLQAEITACRNAGFGNNLTVGLGAHNQAAWLTSQSGIKFVGPTGVTSTNINPVFKQAARTLWQNYVTRFDNDFGLENFRAFRISSISDGEFAYPSAPSRQWQFYDSGAQLGTDLPVGMLRCPHPGWITGTSNNGVTNSTQVNDVFDWYLQSLVNLANYQMTWIKANTGFTGVFEILCPGQGLRPNGLNGLLTGWLPSNVAQVGAVWYIILQKLAALGRTDIVIHITSVGDGSGSPSADDTISPADALIPLATWQANSTYNNWSSVRMIYYLARQYGFKVSGENVGYSAGIAAHYADTSANGLMAKSIAQMLSMDQSNLVSFYWAHDNKFADHTVSPTNYKALAGFGSSVGTVVSISSTDAFKITDLSQATSGGNTIKTGTDHATLTEVSVVVPTFKTVTSTDSFHLSEASSLNTPGSGFPDATNTGIPAGTTLQRVPADVTSGTGWRWRTDILSLSVEADNVVLDSLDVDGGIYNPVGHTGLSVNKCRFRLIGWDDGTFGVRLGSGSTMTDCEIGGGADGTTRGRSSGIASVGTALNPNVLTRLNVHHTTHAIHAAGYTTVQDSYLHDVNMGQSDQPGMSTDHSECVFVEDGFYNIFQHNHMSHGNSAVFFAQNYSDTAGGTGFLTINNNKFTAVTNELGNQSPTGVSVENKDIQGGFANIVLTNNVFDGPNPPGGSYPHPIWAQQWPASMPTGSTVSGNVYVDGTDADPDVIFVDVIY